MLNSSISIAAIFSASGRIDKGSVVWVVAVSFDRFLICLLPLDSLICMRLGGTAHGREHALAF